MGLLDLACGQTVQIPALQLTSGRPFAGAIRSIVNDQVVIEQDGTLPGAIPYRTDDLCTMVWQSGELRRACPVRIRGKNDRELTVQIVIQERREAPRIRAEMQLSYELVLPEQIKDVADEVLAKVNLLGDPDNETNRLLRTQEDPLEQIRGEIAALRDRLGDMMVKIDYLTALVANGSTSQAKKLMRPLLIANCSSTGIGFYAREPLAEGDYLRMLLTLRTVPETRIDCMGTVVRCVRDDPGSSDPNRYDIGVRFTHIHESDRERLIHYLFKVQRRLLRDLKEAREAEREG